MTHFVKKTIATAAIALSCFSGLSALKHFFNAHSAPRSSPTSSSVLWGANCPSMQNEVLPPAPPEETGTHIGIATMPRRECQLTRYQDDLDATIPGADIALGGDSVPGYPQVHFPGYDGDNPLNVPDNTRPLPTGTAIGPHGEQYAFYAIVPYTPGAGYTAPDTAVVDLAHPETILFALRGISQASAAYDAQSGRMIVLGNTPDGHRGLWQSAPLSENAAWQETLQPIGSFSNEMDGNRESQIVALPLGGLLVVGAGDDRDTHATLPLMGVTASTPEGLLSAKPMVLVTPQVLPQVYGPTIADIKVIDGKQIVTIRVSTYGIVGPPGIDHYDPHTYAVTFAVMPAKNKTEMAAAKNNSAVKSPNPAGN